MAGTTQQEVLLGRRAARESLNRLSEKGGLLLPTPPHPFDLSVDQLVDKGHLLPIG